MNKKLNLDGVVTRLADKGYTKKDSAVIIGDMLNVIYEAVADGYEVVLTGFGSFGTIDTKPRRVRNISTGQVDLIPSHKKIKFKPGAVLRRAAEGKAE